jgi:cytoskeletal protein RodZ
VPVTGRDVDDRDGEQRTSSEEPWHNRTGALLGASALAVMLIGILVLAATCVSRQVNEPQEAPQHFVDPSFSATAPGSATPTTTQTITSTSPPVTTDIGDPSATSATTTTSTTTSSSETTTARTTSAEEDEDDETTRTTRRPRTNVTRTLYPIPGN